MSLPKAIAKFLIATGLLDSAQPADKPIVVQRDEQKRSNFKTQVQSAATYDPDLELENLARPSFEPFPMDFSEFEGKKIEAVTATLYEVSENGKAYRLKKYNNKADLLEALSRAREGFKETTEIAPPWRIREAESFSREESVDAAAQNVMREALALIESSTNGDTPFEEVRTQLRESAALLRESFDDGEIGNGSFGSDFYTGARSQYGSGFDANASYMPLIGGPWAKQLYLYQYLDMHRKAFEAFNHNPIAHQLIMLTTYFTLGRSIDHTCNNIEVDEIIREFTDRTEFYARFENQATDLWWAGETFVEWYDNVPEKGQTDFRTIDPSTIWEIITDPEDLRKVYYAHQQYSTPFQDYVTGVPGKDQPASIRYIIRQIPKADFDHWKINVSEWEKRGRTDLFSVLGWVKRFKDLMNARVIKGQLEAAFVWDITITGGDADVESTTLQLPDPYNPGSTFIHNSNVTLKPQSSAMQGSDVAQDIETLLNLIAVGTGTPVQFIGGGTKGSRSASGALTNIEPGTKKFETRQQLLERIAYKYFDRVIDNAAEAGLIDIDEVLKDARTVKRLAVTNEELPDRDDVKQEVQDRQDEADAEAEQKQKDANAAIAAGQQQLALPGGTSTPLVNVNRSQPAKESAALVVSGSKGKGVPLNEDQKRRIEAIKKTKQYARELIEFSFPAVAQEDRSSKLKDLALSEAMEWLPKSIVATMAAKELGITTYDFQEAWAMIVDEAMKGMSIAHIYGQDNKHVPDVAMAQSVQEEEQAKAPTTQQPIVNVPTPPVVNGMKQEPAPPGGGGAVPPGQKPNSGDSKVNLANEHAAAPANPTAPANKFSRAAKSPFTDEGKRNIKAREAERAVVKRALYTQILKEAINPLYTLRTSIARYVLGDPDATAQLEEAVKRTEEMRVRDDDN